MFVKLDKNVKTATCSLMDSKYETEFFFLAEILKNKTRPKFCGLINEIMIHVVGPSSYHGMPGQANPVHVFIIIPPLLVQRNLLVFVWSDLNWYAWGCLFPAILSSARLEVGKNKTQKEEVKKMSNIRSGGRIMSLTGASAMASVSPGPLT